MTALPRADRNLVLALLCVASFAVVFNNLIITPILPDISRDLDVRVAVAGLLVTGYAVFGGVAAVLSGPIIDRLGRRPVAVLSLVSYARFVDERRFTGERAGELGTVTSG